MLDVSIIIISYNTRSLLQSCLQSLAKGCVGLSKEVFVVDNASMDGSADMIAEEFPTVNLIRNDRNVGFAAANNIALASATGRHFILLNSDTIVLPCTLTELVRFMDTTSTCGFCGPKLFDSDGKSHQVSARRFPTVFSAGFAMLNFSTRYPNSRHTMNLHLQNGYDKNFRVDWLTGACLIVRAEAMRAVGYLDEGFFMYFEEMDWCRRMGDVGWEGWYIASAEVIHHGGKSSQHKSNQSEIRPFFGNHPVYWVNSSRRYMKRYHGIMGMFISELIQIVLFSLIWLRNRCQRKEGSRQKAQYAADTIRYLFSRKRV